MSKPMKIRFTYGDNEAQEFKSVGSVHKGPIKLDNLYDTFTNPTYEEISFAQQDGPQNVEIVQSQAEVVNVPLAEVITRAHDKAQQNPSINLQASNQHIDTNAYKIQSEKELIKEYQISSQQVIGQKRQSGKRESIFNNPYTPEMPKEEELERPELKLEEARESEFKKEIIEPANDIKQSLRITQKDQPKMPQNPDQIVLKAPSFKYNPQNEGDRGVMKRQYVRGQKTQKYLYSGIPEKKQDDFIGCFGCCAPKPKTYTISNQNQRQ